MNTNNKKGITLAEAADKAMQAIKGASGEMAYKKLIQLPANKKINAAKAERIARKTIEKNEDKELRVHKEMEFRKELEYFMEHLILIRSLGGVLNFAQGFAVRERVMTTYKFKRECEQLEKIAERLMDAQIGDKHIELEQEYKDMLNYEYFAQIYRIVRHFLGKSPEYIAAMADEFEHKSSIFDKLSKESLDEKK